MINFSLKIDKKELKDLKEMAKEKDRSVGNLIRMAVKNLLTEWRVHKLEEK